MEEMTVTISEDEAMVLFEFFERLRETENLSFAHAVEYLALMKISAQADRCMVAMFKPDYL